MTFVDGLIFKAPHPNAPDFVKMKASEIGLDENNDLADES